MTDDSPIRGFGPETFGVLNAETYDDEHAAASQQAVDFLANMARGGPILEFAIGTGRIAVPLAQLGLSVSGVEASAEMVAKMRAKSGGEDIPVTIGDMSEVGPEGSYDLVFLIFNTLFNLTSQEAQVRCFANAAKRLTGAGAFVIEAFVPDIGLFSQPERVRTRYISKRRLFLEAALHDPVRQVIRYQHLVFTEGGGFKLTPLPLRYAWPAELDLMARLAGLELSERWSDWDRSPFTDASRSHVSVYRRRPAAGVAGRT